MVRTPGSAIASILRKPLDHAEIFKRNTSFEYLITNTVKGMFASLTD